MHNSAFRGRFVYTFEDREEAAACLMAFGEKAEDAVLKLSRPTDVALAHDTVVLHALRLLLN
jgi:hypothetical protein